ncbi:unnamed protein product [Thlaspi arvense]|uniref:Pentatricopeptide repeat-containing protein n=1 Tax=Thlaspi arvense TaxID=13288 RepID=A0AAU9SKN5_THLAR|nr:unnamed protein product [Thlaspi arvense]
MLSGVQANGQNHETTSLERSMIHRNLARSRWQIPCNSSNAFSTFAAALVSFPGRPLFNHQRKDPYLDLSSLSFTQLQNSFGQPRRPNSHLEARNSPAVPAENPTLFPSSSLRIYEFLVRKSQFSCSCEDAKELQLHIIKNGFADDLFLSNTLINVYVRIGDLVSARAMFEEMPMRNSVTWACLISGYAQNDMPSQACGLFREMIRYGGFLNVYAIGSALRACQVSGPCGVRLGLQIHGLISKTPYAFDAIVCNVLISMYGNCMDSADCAFRVFNGIRIKNTVSWNSVISVCSKRGNVLSAFQLFSCMQKNGLGFNFKPSEHTFGSLISAACSSPDCGLCLIQQMLANIEKSGLVQDLYVGSALVSGFARFGMLDSAKKIFEQMGLRNAASINGMMVGLVKQKRAEEALETFLELRNSVKINSDSFVVLLSAFAEFSAIEEGRRRGREVHAYVMRTGLIDSKVAIGNGLINMYAKCGAIHDAISVFYLMVKKDPISWNSIISGLDQNEHFENAITSFCTMRQNGLTPSNFTLISALNSCGSLGWLKMGKQIHCEGVKVGLDKDVSVSNALLALYAETGLITESQKLFSLMADYDHVSWNSIIGAFAGSEEHSFEAVRYFFDMIRDGWVPNAVTFINIISAASSISNIELGHQIHALVLKYHFMDDSAIENALLCLYGKCAGVDECEKIFFGMSDRRDNVSWNSMISGTSPHILSEEGSSTHFKRGGKLKFKFRGSGLSRSAEKHFVITKLVKLKPSLARNGSNFCSPLASHYGRLIYLTYLRVFSTKETLPSGGTLGVEGNCLVPSSVGVKVGKRNKKDGNHMHKAMSSQARLVT